MWLCDTNLNKTIFALGINDPKQIQGDKALFTRSVRRSILLCQSGVRMLLMNAMKPTKSGVKMLVGCRHKIMYNHVLKLSARLGAQLCYNVELYNA